MFVIGIEEDMSIAVYGGAVDTTINPSDGFLAAQALKEIVGSSDVATSSTADYAEDRDTTSFQRTQAIIALALGFDLDALNSIEDAVRLLFDRDDGRSLLHQVQVGSALYLHYEHLPLSLIGLVHDLYEDGLATLDEVVQAISSSIDDEEDYRKFILGVTRSKVQSNAGGETYADFINRAAQNEVTRMVKIADVQNNLMNLPPEKETLRKRYEKALKVLDTQSDK